MRRVVVVILDGLRRDFVDAARTPALHALAAEAECFPAYQTAFPSATRVVSATFATGCHPARHTLQGNSMALLENGRLVEHDVGRPHFLQHKRAVTGCSLAVPTMAQRLAPHGGMVLFNNVSPGAAFAHDPDGFGHVYHRAASLGPGRAPVDDPLRATLDAAGDRAVTERFIAEVLHRRRPPLAVLWLGEPDHIQHNVPLGSPEHLAVLREADRNLGMVRAAVEQERARGDEILLITGSDHGHETVSGVVDIEAGLVAAGLKKDASSDDLVSMPNGTAALIYLHPDHANRADRVEAFLREQDWAGQVIPARELGSVGQAPHNGLAFAVSLRADQKTNRFGIPGHALEAAPKWEKADRIGFGQHGGLAWFEQSPVLMIQGDRFAAGKVNPGRVHVTDLAPSIMEHLGIEAPGMDGAALQHRQ